VQQEARAIPERVALEGGAEAVSEMWEKELHG
jgi:hypothetical protein